MKEPRTLRGALLGRAWGYSLFTKALRADRIWKVIVADHIRPRPGDRILDIGCGNGDLADHVAGVDYVGVDHNVEYLEAARRPRLAGATSFFSADLETLADLDIGAFDVIVGVGILHHLDSDLARRVIAASAAKLRANGRFVTVDPVFHPEQRPMTRVLMALDRGLYVRHPEDYDALVATSFPHRSTTIRTDLNPFPYTHCVIEATLGDAPTEGQHLHE